MTTVLWSIDDENYCFATAGDAMDALRDAGEDTTGREYYSMEVKPLTFAQIDPTDRVLEQMDEDVFDVTQEEDVYPFADTTDAEKEELRALIAGWVAKHVDLTRFGTLGGTKRTFTFTEEDLKEG